MIVAVRPARAVRRIGILTLITSCHCWLSRWSNFLLKLLTIVFYLLRNLLLYCLLQQTCGKDQSCPDRRILWLYDLPSYTWSIFSIASKYGSDCKKPTLRQLESIIFTTIAANALINTIFCPLATENSLSSVTVAAGMHWVMLSVFTFSLSSTCLCMSRIANLSNRSKAFTAAGCSMALSPSPCPYTLISPLHTFYALLYPDIPRFYQSCVDIPLAFPASGIAAFPVFFRFFQSFVSSFHLLKLQSLLLVLVVAYCMLLLLLLLSNPQPLLDNIWRPSYTN